MMSCTFIITLCLTFLRHGLLLKLELIFSQAVLYLTPQHGDYRWYLGSLGIMVARDLTQDISPVA